jgi:hypothetical protein
MGGKMSYKIVFMYQLLNSPAFRHGTMMHNSRHKVSFAAVLLFFVAVGPTTALAQKENDEITPDSERALKRGLEWLHKNQGPEGNWGSNDLGLVGMGALAFLSDGHMPGRGKYGRTVERALNYILKNAKPSGLLNISNPQRDMYNHGLATFVLGQAHGMMQGKASTGKDKDMNTVLARALKLIANTQADDGGWDYQARAQPRGHDLSLAVMQAKALRSAVDSGLEIPPEVVALAIKSVREHYTPLRGSRTASEAEQQKHPGSFTYNKGGGRGTIAMCAAGVVCLQEFGQYDDWRIQKNMELITAAIVAEKTSPGSGRIPMGAYTMYYVGQALYQVGGKDWKQYYPILRDKVVASQYVGSKNQAEYGRWNAAKHVSGRPGDLYGTSVACFILAMPNRYLPILQEGKIEGLRKKFGTK